MTIPEQAVETAAMIGEACAGCGKEIGMLDSSVYVKAPADDIGQSYHTGCYVRASSLLGVEREAINVLREKLRRASIVNATGPDHITLSEIREACAEAASVLALPPLSRSEKFS